MYRSALLYEVRKCFFGVTKIVLRQTPKTERLFSQDGTEVFGSTFWLDFVRNTGLEVLNFGAPSGLIGSSLKDQLMEGIRNCGEQAVLWPKAA